MARGTKNNKYVIRELQKKTEKNAWRLGQPWDHDEVSVLVNGINRDKTTYDIAMSMGRSYYGVQSARAHVAFAMRHSMVLVPALLKEEKKTKVAK